MTSWKGVERHWSDGSKGMREGTPHHWSSRQLLPPHQHRWRYRRGDSVLSWEHCWPRHFVLLHGNHVQRSHQRFEIGILRRGVLCCLDKEELVIKNKDWNRSPGMESALKRWTHGDKTLRNIWIRNAPFCPSWTVCRQVAIPRSASSSEQP